MKTWNGLRTWFCIGICIPALLSAGCKEYDVRVKIMPDGGGSRYVELTTASVTSSNEESAYEEFTELFSLYEKDGWTVNKRKVEGNGEEGHRGYIYTLERHAKDLDDWREMSGDINIRAALPGGTYHKVKFQNTIGVEIAHGAHAKSITYHETLGWDSLKEELIDFFATWYQDSISATYPELGSVELAELRGLFAGHLAMGLAAVEETGDFDGESVARDMVSMATGIIRRARPDAATEDVYGITEAVLNDSTNKFERFAAREMPGFELAFFTGINLSVTMPGRIVESNADEVQERTAIWNLDIMQTINRPIELFVRAEVAE